MSESKTNVPSGATGAMIQQAVGVFHTCMQRNTTLNRLTGKMPTIENAIAGAKRQSKPTMPIVRADDLGKNKGDEITFHLDNPISGYPIMGSEYAEGKGVGMSFSEDRLRVNQARFPVDMGNTMTQIRSPYDLRRLGRPKAQQLMNDYIDQSILVHLAGARGFHDNKIEWRVPLASHPKFKEIMVNRVKAPTRNRHLVAGGGAVGEVKANAGDLTIATTDMFTMDVVDSLRSWMDQIPLPPPPVEFEGDLAATDSPIRVALVSPAQYSGFATNPDFRSFQANAYARPAGEGPPAVPRRRGPVERHPHREDAQGDPVLRRRRPGLLRRLRQRGGIPREGAGIVRLDLRGGPRAAARRPGAGAGLRQLGAQRHPVLLVGREG